MQGYLHSIKKAQSSLELKINLPNLRTKNREDMKIKIKHIDWQPYYVPVVRKKVIKGMRVVEPPTAKDPLEQSCGCVIMDAVLTPLATGKYFSDTKISYAIGCTPTAFYRIFSNFLYHTATNTWRLPNQAAICTLFISFY